MDSIYRQSKDEERCFSLKNMSGTQGWSQIVEIPCYKIDSSPEELKPISRNLKPTINSDKFQQQLALSNQGVPRSYSKSFVNF